MDSYLKMASRVNMGAMSHTSPQYVKIWESTNSTDPVEVPLERDGNLLISTIVGQFPNTVGLRFWSDTGAWRGLKSEENIIYPPPQGWGNTDYYIVLGPAVAPLKRVNEETSKDTTEGPLSKAVRTEVEPTTQQTAQVIEEETSEEAKSVRNVKKNKPPGVVKKTVEEKPIEYIIQSLPYSMTEDDLKNHFEEFGELESVKVMRERDTGNSRGFAFLRFKTIEGDRAAKEGIHIFNHRRYWLLPSKRKEHTGGGEESDHHHHQQQRDFHREREQKEQASKLFVGRIPSAMNESQIREHFSKFGVLKDVYIPQPHKGYGFIQYRTKEIADRVLEETHVVDGTFLNVSYPTTQKKSDDVVEVLPDERHSGFPLPPSMMRGNGRPGILGMPGSLYGRGMLGAPWEQNNGNYDNGMGFNNMRGGMGNIMGRGRGMGRGGMRY